MIESLFKNKKARHSVYICGNGITFCYPLLQDAIMGRGNPTTTTTREVYSKQKSTKLN